MIDPKTARAARELCFYTRFVAANSELSALAPRFVDYRPVEGSRFGMLTIERIKGRRCRPDDFPAIRDAWVRMSRASELMGASGIQSFQRSSSVDRLRRVRSRFFGRRAIGIETAAWLHTREACEGLFAACEKRLRQDRATPLVRAAVGRLRSLWFELAVPQRIDPFRHYSLVHGDFHPGNMLIEEESGRCRVFDWEACSWGPSSFDLTRLGVVNGFTFHDIRRNGLLHSQIIRASDPRSGVPVVGIMLVLLVTAKWLLERSIKDLNDTFEQTIEPALGWLDESIGNGPFKLPADRDN